MLTEKSNFMRAKLNKYVFLVHKEANKTQIKDALEVFYKVDVKAVHIVNAKSKVKTYNYKKGIRPGFKKAFVTLERGSEFKFYEGV